MFRDSVINFLQLTLVLLGVTNLFSIVVAGYAIAFARGLDGAMSRPPARLRLARSWPDGRE